MPAFLLTTLLLFSPTPAAASSPWQLLKDMRTSLHEAGPTTATFTQTYTPAGFSSGDEESGFFSLWLPRCLRWNYEEPDEKSFLLCEDEVWLWNIGEDSGRYKRIDPGQEPGLDLLLVDVARLQERYSASSEKLADGTFEISLSTTPEQGGLSAKINLDPTRNQVIAMEYRDKEGNLTRFEIGEYQPLSHTGLFRPPGDMQWIEE
jgi:outer membrane lipoprotein-sorting protein